MAIKIKQKIVGYKVKNDPNTGKADLDAVSASPDPRPEQGLAEVIQMHERV